jgi:hypothetical protein
MVDLTQLKSEIEALGEKVKELKTSGGDKDAIGAAVAEMLALKKEYADNNKGIGIDGNPYEEPLSKAQKKAKLKAEKDATTTEGATGAAAKMVSAVTNCGSIALLFTSSLFSMLGERLFFFFFFFFSPAPHPILILISPFHSIPRRQIPIPRELLKRRPRPLPKPRPKRRTRRVMVLLRQQLRQRRARANRGLLQQQPPPPRPSRQKYRRFPFP